MTRLLLPFVAAVAVLGAGPGFGLGPARCPVVVDSGGEYEQGDRLRNAVLVLQRVPNDAAAANVLLTELQDIVTRVAASRLRDRSTIDDIAGTLLLEVLQRYVVPRRPPPDHFIGWVVRCTLNAIVSDARRRARDRNHQAAIVERSVPRDPFPEHTERRWERLRELALAYANGLGEGGVHRQVLLLHFAGSRGYEIARLVGRDEGQVSRILHDGTERILDLAVADGTLSFRPENTRLSLLGIAAPPS